MIFNMALFALITGCIKPLKTQSACTFWQKLVLVGIYVVCSKISKYFCTFCHHDKIFIVLTLCFLAELSSQCNLKTEQHLKSYICLHHTFVLFAVILKLARLHVVSEDVWMSAAPGFTQLVLSRPWPFFTVEVSSIETSSLKMLCWMSTVMPNWY